MKVRLLLLVALGAISTGCATPPETTRPTGASSAQATPLRSSRTALTGTRLVPLDDDDSGRAPVSEQPGTITGTTMRLG